MAEIVKNTKMSALRLRQMDHAVSVEAGDADDLVDIIEKYYATKPIYIPPGTYAVTKIIDGITLDEDAHTWIFGAGSEAVTITTSQTKFIDIANTAYESGDTHPITISGMKIEHNCQNATDVTLDLLNAQAKMHDIQMANTNATKQGIAVLCGSGTAVSPTGAPCTWMDLVATHYGTGFKTGLDHSALINCVANTCLNKGFFLIDPKVDDEGTNYANWITLESCQTTSNADTRGTVYPFYFQKVGYGIAVLGGSHEDATAITNNLFHMDQTAPTDYVVHVSNFTFHNNQNDKMTNDFERIRFKNCGSKYNTVNDCSEWEDVNADPWPSPTGGTWEGRFLTMYNAHATFAGNPYRDYRYINGGWHYTILDA